MTAAALAAFRSAADRVPGPFRKRGIKHNSGVEMLSWEPSAAFRVLCAVRGILGSGAWYLVLFLLFPHVLLIPFAAIAALGLPAIFVRVRVALDPGLGEVGIRWGWWTRRIPLIEIESVDEVLRFGAEIRLRNGTGWSMGPLKKSRRRLARWLRVRTGFEGMELSIIEAVAAARAAAGLSKAAAPEDTPPGYLAGFMIFTGGLIAMGCALLVHPQVDAPAIHVAATLLTIWCAFWSAVLLLIGGIILFSRVRRARTY
jgi:hypothetical protein